MVPFRILALGSGGSKGHLHIGALQELESRVGSLTKHFAKGIYGCSIGAIIATGIAFGLSIKQLDELSKKFITYEAILGKIDLASISKAQSRKGIFEMDKFETQILAAFDSEGIDLRGKYIDDSLIPLHIISSNLTKGIPTVFKKKVPLLPALRASCCVPFLFRPQIFNGSVYIDGAFMTNVIHKLIPKEHQDETLSLSITHTNPRISPSDIESMATTDFMYKLYKITCLYEHYNFQHPNIVRLCHAGGSGFVDKTDEDKEDMKLTGRCIMRSFLAKRSL